ncbi:MAG: esterase family protein [Ignavibacteriae bacterium]|nr:esterase family protein [Ignavibacteriota bacterium]
MKTKNEISNNIFKDFYEQILSANDLREKQKLADSLISIEKTFPLVEDDTTVVLIYQGDADSVAVLGDMGNWVDKFPMNKIEGTNLFYLRQNYPSDARLEYWLQFGKEELPATDPLNPYKTLNGFGEISELAMPDYFRHQFFDDYKFGKKGELDLVNKFLLPEGILPYEHDVHVYLPPDYSSGNENYPAVYFQDGIDYIEFAQTPFVINNLIKDNLIEPVIAVFVTSPNRHIPEEPNRMTEYGMNDNYVKFFTDELVPWVDSKFRTIKNSQSRLVVGDSFGGLISTYIAFSRPDVFGLAYSQSGYHSFQKDRLIKKISEAEQKNVRLYVDTGIYERKVGAAFLPKEEGDFLLGNRRLKDILEKKNYDFVYKEYNEGHTWGNWRRHLIDALIHFFGTNKGLNN